MRYLLINNWHDGKYRTLKKPKTQFLIEKRINELVKQYEGIPAKEVLQLLMKADRNPALNIERELSKLFLKYEKVRF